MNFHQRAPQIFGKRGFTLLEVSLAMGIMLILGVGIFTLTTGSAEITEELTEFQKKHISKKRFIELCRTNFESLPGHAKVEFRVVDKGAYYATYLSIIDDPFVFTFGGDASNIKRVVIEADVASTGYLDASLLYLSSQENVAFQDNSFDPSLVLRKVKIMDRLRQLTWRFYDSRSRQWREFLDPRTKPSLIELTIATEGDNQPERIVFWIPPAKPVTSD